MKRALTIAAAVAALLCLSLCPEPAIRAAAGSLSYCIAVLLPSLFPFFCVCGVLNALGFPRLAGERLSRLWCRVFRCSPVGAGAFFLGLSGGYPLGAACIAGELRAGTLSREEAEHLLFFCSNTGPAFLIGAIGSGIFSRTDVGLLLYLSHALAAVTLGLLSRPAELRGEKIPAAVSLPFSDAFSRAVVEAMENCLRVAAFVVCFSVLAGLLESMGLFSLLCGWLSLLGVPTAHGTVFLRGLLELGSAASVMGSLLLSPGSLALVAFTVGWGGLSVQFQTEALFADANISLRSHRLGRLCSGLLSGGYAYLLSLAFL